MKILIISEVNSLCKYGGGETFNRELIKYLLNQGHEVLEWTAFIGQKFSRYENLYEKNKNYHLVYSKIFQKHPNKIKQNIIDHWKFNKDLEKFLDNKDFDLIISSCYLLNFVKIKKRDNFIQVCHDDPEILVTGGKSKSKIIFWIKYFFNSMLNFGNIFLNVKNVIFSDVKTQQKLLSFSSKFEKIQKFIIPYPINELSFDFKQIENQKEENKEVIWIGRMIKHKKNIKYLNEVAKYLEKDNVKINVYGIGRAKKYLNSKNIIHHGWIDDGLKKYEALIKNKVFLMVSKFEGFPLVLIESLSVGTPIVALNNFPSINFLNNSDGVFVLDSNTKAKKYAEKIVEIINLNKKEYLKLVKENLEFYKENLSNKRFYENIDKLLEYFKK
ncbi:MAG: glycosyltransferase family 4 protein [Mycoplasmataceae bacterium]|nr:glycosyltransferase family 4 protein [Mycoplasmataceae bacterium]